MTALIEGCSTRTLLVGARMRWFSVSGAPPVDLSKRPVLRALFEVLVAARVRTPGAPVTISQFIEIAWANDRSLNASIQNRLCVGIAGLRKMGLDGMLITQRGRGYFLDPAVDLDWSPHVIG
jgi:hypothetical protein